MQFTLEALNEAALELGKAVLLYANEWNGSTDLALQHLGHTEGAVKFDAKESIAGLKLPEEYGEGMVKAYVVGADPVLTAPLFLADPALRAIITPTGDGVIGSGVRQEVKKYTLVALPRALFYDADTKKNTASIGFTSPGGWTKTTSGDPSGRALTEDEERLLGLGIWMFSGYWERPPVTYEATVTDVVKNVEECTFHVIRPSAAALSGIMAIVGLPEDYDIDIQPVAS